VMLRLQLASGAHLLARVTRRSAQGLMLAVGQQVYAQVKGVALLG
jgi:molybdate transport system ATP-binding protein